MGWMTALTIGAMVYGAVQQKKQTNAVKKAAEAQAQQAPLAPAPAATSLTPPAPPLLDPGKKQSLANGAALKQKKKAVGGSILTRPKAPVSNAMPVAARTMPRSLVGGY